MTIKSFLWLTPFIFFLTGYYLTYRLFLGDACEVPSVIGKSTYEALRLISEARLNARIVAEKEDVSLAEGTVISQNPKSSQKAKSQQSIFLVVSKKPPVLLTPIFVGHTECEAQILAEKKAIALKKIFLSTNAPKGTCLAQLPAPGSVLDASGCMLYISEGTDVRQIMPDCTGLPVHDAVSFFKDFGATVQVFHDYQPEGHQCFDCLVKDQRPFPGACIDTSRPLALQLSAE